MKQGLFNRIARGIFVLALLPLSFSALALTDSPELIIIGAGVSGLRAAEYLKSQGFSNFIILEGRDHIGGRTYTYHAANPAWHNQGLDLGASWVHGAGPYNPLTHVVEKIKVPYKVSESENVTLYNEAGHEVSEREQRVGTELYNRFIRYVRMQQWGQDRGLTVSDALKTFVQKHRLSVEQQSQLIYRVTALIEQEYAADITQLSLKYYDSDEAFKGPEWLLTGGYSQVVHYLARDLQGHIILNQKVNSIDYSQPNQVLVTTTDGHVYHAKTVINTLPIGVLKRGTVQFRPELPMDKKIALSHINMGIQDKIWLQFPKKFWDDSEFLERQIRTYLSHNEWLNKGRYIEFVNMQYYMGKPILMAMVSGDFAHKMEHESDAQILAEIMQILRKIYGASIPNPEAHVITRWGQDPFAYGSYSSLAPGAINHGDDYFILSKPIGRRLFFAGEGTHKYYPGTVHGAYLSGEREAKRFLRQNIGTVRDVNNTITGFTYFNSGDVTTWGAKNYGIELFPTYEYFRRSHDFTLPVTFGYGVTNNIDVSATLYTLTRERHLGEPSHQGMGDVAVGTKYVFYNVFQTMTDVAFDFEATFPTGNLNKHLSDGLNHYTPTMIVGHNVFFPTWDVQIFGQIGVDAVSRQKSHFVLRENDAGSFLVRDDEHAARSLIFNAGAAAMNDYVLLSIEYNVFDSAVWDRLGTNQSYVTPGIKWFVNRQMYVGFGAPIGVTHAAAQYALIGTMAYMFEPSA